VIFESVSRVREIGNKAFFGCAMKLMRIPKSVEIIGDSCFFGCDFLAQVICEEGSKLKTIGKGAFSSCPRLKTVKVTERL
jgi:hypothetical protein